MAQKYPAKLMFDRPADDFRESFVLGNGRIGASVFGNLKRERILLNETSLWSGSPSYTYPEDVYKILPEIQRLVFEGKYREAQDLYEKEFLVYDPMPMDGANCALLPYGSIQTLGELDLYFFQFTSGCDQEWYPFKYHRELDFEKALVNIEHRSFWQTNTPGADKGFLYYRQAFVSHKGECFAMKISSSKEHNVGFNAQLSRSEYFEVHSVGKDSLLMTGQLPDGRGGFNVRYACLLKVVQTGGTIEAEPTNLRVREAQEAVLYVTAATDMKCFGARNLDDPVKAVFDDMDRAVAFGWADLLQDNIQKQEEIFNRNRFSLNEPDPAIEALPIDERLRRKLNGAEDEGLFVLMYNYGRYLFTRASRPGGMPMGIMGIWGEEIQAPFNGDYHINAQQIMYWASDVCNMSELQEPYFRLAEALQGPGADVAKAFYNSRGWVAHVFTNPWLFALPGGEAHWGATIVGGAWLVTHLWEHYLYTCDREFLKWAYPIIKGSALFLLDRLVTDPELGKKVLFPGNTPENYFIDPQTRKPAALCQGTAFDMELTRYLFEAAADAADLVGEDNDLAEELRRTIPDLAPLRIGSDGRVMEWQREMEEAKPYHRHISPLWGVFPGHHITPEEDPEFIDASVKLIRGRTFTGHTWAMVHRIGVLARLYQAEYAHEIMSLIMQYGLFANLLCHEYFTMQDETTPEDDFQDPFKYNNIFEIDGNTGFPAVIAEMLMQSYREGTYQIDGREEKLRIIQLLPTLPQEWSSGYNYGLKARGGFTVDLEWADHELTKVTVTGKAGQAAAVRYKGKDVIIRFEKEEAITITEDAFL